MVGFAKKIQPKLALKIFSYIFVALLILTTIILLKLDHKSSIKSSAEKTLKPINADQYKEITSKQNSEALKDNNLQLYLYSMENNAIQYMNEKKYDKAEQTMKEVFSKVPQDKIDVTGYAVMANIQKTQKDAKEYKYYLGLLVGVKRAAGDTSGANESQKILDTLK